MLVTWQKEEYKQISVHHCTVYRVTSMYRMWGALLEGPLSRGGGERVILPIFASYSIL